MAHSIKDKSDVLLVSCDNCSDEGYIFVDEVYSAKFIRCYNCGDVTCDLWCPACEVSGKFIRHFHPSKVKEWKCPECGMRYDLPSNFYQKLYNLYHSHHIPMDVKKQFNEVFNVSVTKSAVLLMFVLSLTIVVLIFLAVRL